SALNKGNYTEFAVFTTDLTLCSAVLIPVEKRRLQEKRSQSDLIGCFHTTSWS
ncbi:hypothetical protein M9458_014626, partial [Cirrhinus mrigala]